MDAAAQRRRALALSRRAHDAATRGRLAELFGSREQWASAPRWLTWSMTTVTVPAFTASTTVALPVACTYDFEEPIDPRMPNLSPA